MARRPIFLDANLLSIFTEIDRVDLLMRLLNAHELHVSPTIVNELSTAVKRGHIHVQAALDRIGAGRPIGVTALSTSPAHFQETVLACLHFGVKLSFVSHQEPLHRWRLASGQPPHVECWPRGG